MKVSEREDIANKYEIAVELLYMKLRRVLLTVSLKEEGKYFFSQIKVVVR